MSVKRLMMVCICATSIAAGLTGGAMAQATYYVATNGTHQAPFDSWIKAATNVHDAVALAGAGDTVWVSNGVYRLTNELAVATNVTIQSVNGPGETALSRDPAAGNFRIVSVTHDDALVAGFTVTNGYITAGSGAGVNVLAGTVSNCVVTRCHMEGYGGVVNVSGGLMTRCVVTNAESGHSRNIVNVGGTGVLEDSEIVGCASIERSPLWMAGGTVRRARIHHNVKGGQVGGVYLQGGLLENCLVYANVDGGVQMVNAAARMVNCTVAGNAKTGGTGSGVNHTGGSITNCILYGNGGGAPGDNFSGSLSFAWYSCAPELTNAPQGNATGDPRFLDAAAFDYRLAAASPALDAGTNLAAVVEDIDGGPRPQAADSRGILRHDMGAYEKDGASGPLEVGFAGSPLAGLNSVTSVFTAAVAGTNTTITWWGWDFDGDGAYETSGTDLAVVTNTFGLGSYTVVVRATNSVGETAAATNVDYVTVSGLDVYVATGGGHVAPFASWADAATNLNDAVDVALAGSTVHVSNGAYRITKKVDLFTDFTIRSVNGPGVTTVYRDAAFGKFGLFDLRATGALVVGLTMTNGNVSGSSGAALGMTAGTVSNCVISKCLTEASYGGAITISGGRMTDCVITNMAHWYPMMVLSGTAIVEDCRVVDSTANEQGVCRINAGAIVRRCRFARITGNTPYVYVGGGGALENSLVHDAAAAGPYLGPAGGVYLAGGRMVHCTVARNTRTSGTASGVYRIGGVVTNCVVYGNGSAVTDANGVAAPLDDYWGDIAACWYSCAPELTNAAQGNIILDPRFRDSAGGDFRLLAVASPALDAGTNLATVVEDIDGGPRPRAADSRGNVRHDMGAWEKDGGSGPLEVGCAAVPFAGFNSITSVFTAAVSGTNTTITWWGWDFDGDGTLDASGPDLAVVTNTYGLGRYTVVVRTTNSVGETAAATNANYVLVVTPDIYVSPGGNHVLPFISWADAATNFNDAVDVALAGCTVHVAGGSYPTRKRVNMFADFTIRGENGPEVTTVWRDPAAGLFGMFDLRSSGAVLEGITITNGGPVAQSAVNMTAGAVSNCVIRDCDSQWAVGGMIRLTGGRMSRCVVTSNFAFYVLASVNSPAVLEDSRIVNNTCGQYGLIQLSSWPLPGGVIRRTVIADNTASYHTAGVQMGSGLLENCLVAGNVSQSTGGANGAGGVYISGGAMVNCTVTGNDKPSGSPSAGGVVRTGGTITNCVIYGNTGGVASNYNGVASACWYTACPELTAGVQGNITDDPQFKAPASANYRLAGSSPCVNTGLNGPGVATALDLDARPRLRFGIVDMGAYEYAGLSGTVLFLR